MKTKAQKRWGRGGDFFGTTNPSPCNHGPLAGRRRTLWERALALGLNLSDAAAYVATVLRSEMESGHVV